MIEIKNEITLSINTISNLRNPLSKKTKGVDDTEKVKIKTPTHRATLFNKKNRMDNPPRRFK